MKETSKRGFLRKSQRDYSLAFKLALVDQVDIGQLTYKQAQQKYGIQGRTTVLILLRKHGTLDWKSKAPMKDKQPPRTMGGYAVAVTMEAGRMSKALEIALKQKQTDTETIHHPDRDLKSCSNQYVSLTTGGGMRMSMPRIQIPTRMPWPSA